MRDTRPKPLARLQGLSRRRWLRFTKLRHDTVAGTLSGARPIGELVNRKLVSIVVPFYNEAPGVGRLHEALSQVFAAMPGIDFEVVCVEDGSRDATLMRLLEVVARDARFRWIELSRNFGKECAITAGIDAAMGDAVIPFDADLQDPPEL